VQTYTGDGPRIKCSGWPNEGVGRLSVGLRKALRLRMHFLSVHTTWFDIAHSRQ
jgi:hypothetical protein